MRDLRFEPRQFYFRVITLRIDSILGPIICHLERVKFPTVLRGRRLRNINMQRATQGTVPRTQAGQ